MAFWNLDQTRQVLLVRAHHDLELAAPKLEDALGLSNGASPLLGRSYFENSVIVNGIYKMLRKLDVQTFTLLLTSCLESKIDVSWEKISRSVIFRKASQFPTFYDLVVITLTTCILINNFPKVLFTSRQCKVNEPVKYIALDDVASDKALKRCKIKKLSKD